MSLVLRRMIGGKASVNGTIVPESEARVPVDNLAFAYGYGVYENLNVRKGTLLDAKEHVARLHRSAEQIGLPVPSGVLDWLQAFVEEVPEESFNVKIMVVGPDCYIFATRPLFLPAKAYKHGVKAITVAGERPFPRAKTLSMLSSYLAYTKAKSENAYDALLIDHRGNIPEGTRTNLFFTDGKTIFTPPSSDVLEGVTRAHVIKTLERRNIPFEERRLKKEDLGKYTGYFLTSTSAKVLPVCEIDRRKFAIPSIVQELLRAVQEP